MELSKKQIWVISIVSGVVLLLAIGAAVFLSPGAADAPEASPEPASMPTASPAPTETPAPTIFLLPLVPQWDTPQPTAASGAVGAFVPRTGAPPQGTPGKGAEGPWVSAGDEHSKDILAVGLQDGRTAALLLLRLTGQEVTVTALPAEGLPLAGASLEEKGAQAAALAEAATGRRYEGWMALDLTCLPAVLRVTGPLAGPGAEALAEPEDALAMAEGALRYARRAAVWQFPALRQAVGDCFASGLSGWELWKLLWALRRSEVVRCQTWPI